MWIKALILIYLIILGIKDAKDRKIPLTWLMVGAIFLGGIGVRNCVLGEMNWWEMLLGVIPGVFLLAVAWLTGKAGYADGLVLMELGLCLGYRESLFLFGLGLSFLSIVSVMLLLLRKVKKDTRMPYLSFLAIVFLLRQL